MFPLTKKGDHLLFSPLENEFCYGWSFRAVVGWLPVQENDNLPKKKNWSENFAAVKQQQKGGCDFKEELAFQRRQECFVFHFVNNTLTNGRYTKH